VAFLRGQRHSRGGGAPDIDLEVGEEKGTNAVLVKVKAALEVDRSGSAT
jgi:hypothetical protein